MDPGSMLEWVCDEAHFEQIDREQLSPGSRMMGFSSAVTKAETVNLVRLQHRSCTAGHAVYSRDDAQPAFIFGRAFD